MACLLRNITDGFERILKEDVGPQEALDLEEVFTKFCKPKKASKEGKARFSMFRENQFDTFVEWVKSEFATDPGTWRFEGDYFTKKKVAKKAAEPKEESESVSTETKKRPPSPKPRSIKGQRKRRNRKTAVGKKDGVGKNMTPRQIAYLPFNDETKNFINTFSDYKALKAAYKLLRTMSGQEKLRKHVETRIIDMEMTGTM